MAASVPKVVLIVRGWWEEHSPIEATELFIPYLREHGYELRVEDAPRVYADARYMAGVDLIVQCMTMSSIEGEEFAGLRAAVEAPDSPAGMAASPTPTATPSTTCT